MNLGDKISHQLQLINKFNSWINESLTGEKQHLAYRNMVDCRRELNKKNFEITKNIDLSELCIISSAQVEITDQNEVMVETEKAKGDKCSVCWKISLQPCERHGT